MFITILIIDCFIFKSNICLYLLVYFILFLVIVCIRIFVASLAHTGVSQRSVSEQNQAKVS